MENRSDYGTVELGGVVPKLRDDLVFRLQQYAGQPCYVVEDPANCRFYRIGIAEYSFISLLDGRTPVREAMAETAAQLGPDAFSAEDAAGICKWLIDSQLASTPQSGQAARLLDTAETSADRRRRQWLNPIMLKVPLLRPDRFFQAVYPLLRSLVGWQGLLVWLIVVALAIYQLVENWGRASAMTAQIVARDNWLWLVGTWVVLKFLHELFHGLMCRKFGGEVREAGALFILLAPIPYVDVTSCWRFPSKWQRIATSAAGMYIEIFAAAAATIVWSQTDDNLVRHHAYNVMLIGSVTTLFFNANPLMRFDGYYILADWLELPNLYGRGQQYVAYLGRRWILGVRTAVSPRSAAGRPVVKCYGVAALCWRVFICACLLVAAESLLFGAGIALAAVALIWWLVDPTSRLVRYLAHGNDFEKPDLKYFALVAVLGSSLIFLFLVAVPWPGGLVADVVVDYEDARVIRLATSGFVQKLCVESGDRVTAGDILARLDNPELKTELEELKLAIKLSRLRARQFHTAEEIAAEQAEIKTREALQKRAAELQKQVDHLIVRAPIDGTVIGSELDTLAGTYLPEGGRLLTIGDANRKELRVSISQEDIQQFRQYAREPVRVRLLGNRPRSFDGYVDQISPRASSDVPHPALCAPGGGRLPVKQAVAGDTEVREDQDVWQLLTPRFLATIPLSPENSRKLKVGQVGLARLYSGGPSVGAQLSRRLREWFETHIQSSMLN